MVIRGKGYQDILCPLFGYHPSTVLVNGIPKTLINQSCELDNEGDNNVTVIFDSQIKSKV